MPEHSPHADGIIGEPTLIRALVFDEAPLGAGLRSSSALAAANQGIPGVVDERDVLAPPFPKKESRRESGEKLNQPLL